MTERQIGQDIKVLAMSNYAVSFGILATICAVASVQSWFYFILNQNSIDQLLDDKRAEYMGVGSDRIYVMVDNRYIYELREEQYELRVTRD